MDYINLYHSEIFCMAKILGQSKMQKPAGGNICNIYKGEEVNIHRKNF